MPLNKETKPSWQVNFTIWRIKDELLSDVLQWTPTHGHTSIGRPTRTYLHQLYTDKGCNLKDLPEAMDDRDERRERVRETRARRIRWWWWWWKLSYKLKLYLVFWPGLGDQIFWLGLWGSGLLAWIWGIRVFWLVFGSARGVMVIVVGNWHFTLH